MSVEDRIARRALDVTWREAVAARVRQMRASPASLACFDALTSAGCGDAEAAYRALAAHGLLWSIQAHAPLSGAPPPGRHDVPEV